MARPTPPDHDARLARIEATQAAMAELLRALADGLDMQREMLRRVLAAVEREPGPSPALAELHAIRSALDAQTELMLRVAPAAGDEAPP